MTATATMPTDIGWIQTAGGGRFYPLDPNPTHVDIKDVAAALSKNCRFTGHCSAFYSVAEHSCLVQEILEVWGENVEVQMWGLLHDASEAYLSDIARPLKHQPEFKFYREVEERVQRAVATKFGLSWPEPRRVKEADNLALAVEAKYLMPQREKDKWSWLPAIPEWLDMEGPTLGIPPDEAEGLFFALYHTLEASRV